MRKRGFIVKHMKEDGACLFRAVSDQVFGDQEMHDIVRKQCMDYIVSIEERGLALYLSYQQSHGHRIVAFSLCKVT